jgi:hypothetical protein
MIVGGTPRQAEADPLRKRQQALARRKAGRLALSRGTSRFTHLRVIARQWLHDCDAAIRLVQRHLLPLPGWRLAGRKCSRRPRFSFSYRLTPFHHMITTAQR